MNNETLIHNYRLPNVYCILVVDDKINDKNEKYVANKNCFEACIKAAIAQNGEKCDVLIDYAADINKGFDQWVKGSYDLVLIDYDFSAQKTQDRAKPLEDEADKVPEFMMSDIFSEKQGLELFRFVRQLTESSYKYRKNFQSVYLWTSHRLKKGNGGVEQDLTEDEKNFYLKKESGGHRKIQRILANNRRTLSSYTTKTDEKYLQYILERLVFLSNRKKYNLQGYVALKKNATDGTTTLYPSLVDGTPIYLLPYKPDTNKFNTCSLDWLHYRATTNNTNETKKIKGPIGKGLYKELIDGESETKSSRFTDKYIDDLRRNRSEIYKKTLVPELKKEKTVFAGVKFDSDIWLAATPLTMASCVGDKEQVFNLLINKLDAFFRIGIGAAVLKTTYLESDGIEWPNDHIQRHHRTRVFSPGSNKNQLWNTGKTKLEAFPPRMLCEFLKKVRQGKRDCWKNKIIVSLGLKIDTEKKQKGLIQTANKTRWEREWEAIFNMVFDGDRNDDFYPLVEINVRHFLRPILGHELLGDEYLAPLDGNRIANYKRVLKKFKTVLEALNKIGELYKKKLILKFPFRSDITPFLDVVKKQVNKKSKYGIKGITLINAAKSPYPYALKEQLSGNGDSIKILQMSGELLAWLRNYLLCKLKHIKFNLPISVSGGAAITNDDVKFLRKQPLVKSIQLGTLVLKDIRQLKDKFGNDEPIFLNISKKTKLKPRIIHFLKNECIRCGKCYNSFYCDAYLNRGIENGEYPLIDVTACTGCGLCVQNCHHRELELVPANKYVILCCPFSESRALILRENRIPFMFMTPEETSVGGEAVKGDIKEVALKEARRRAEVCYKQAKKPIDNGSEEINPLEHSIFIGVKTYILGKKNTKYERIGIPSNEKAVVTSLNQYENFKALTAYSCWNDGIKIKEEVIESDDFILKIDSSHIGKYARHGINKAGGIDILGHGDILFGNLRGGENYIMTFAGLPLQAIELIESLRNNG